MKNRRTRKGFSLIELLYAVFLTGLCAVLLAATIPMATGSREKADLYNKATSLAQKQIEAVRGLGYANLTPAQLASYGLIDSTATVAANTYSFTNSDSAANDAPSSVLPSGTGTVRIEQVELDLRRVTITVNFRLRGENRSIQVATLVANL